MRYTVMIDGEAGAYGVMFPDLPGCTAMGETVDEALANAAEAVRDWATATLAQGRPVPPPSSPDALRADPEVAQALAEGALLASAPLILDAGHMVKANLSLDSGVLAAIDAAALRLGMNRSALVELMARRGLPELV